VQLTGQSWRGGGRLNGELQPTWLARWVVPHADLGSARIRDGRLSGALYLTAAAYSLALLPQLHPHILGMAILTALIVVAGVTMLMLPWRRMANNTLWLPVLLGIAFLSLGCGAWLGELSHFEPIYLLISGFTGLVLPPGRTLRAVALELLGLGVAAGLGHQTLHLVELTGTILISGLMGELVAGAVAVQRQHRVDLERLQTGLTGLLEAESQDDASLLISRLAANLLQADGVTVMTREGVSSPWLVGRGGYGRGIDFDGVRLNIDEEQSVSGLTVKTARVLFIPDVPSHPIIARRHTDRLAAASVLYLPIVGRSEVIGVIAIWWSSPIAQLDAFAEQVVRLLSIQAGPVLERVRQVEDLDRAALTDPLTGVGNRRAYEHRLKTLPANAAVIICDLDHFKVLNDTQGHPAGDRVLRAFAAVAASSIRDGDLVARIGGDEFALIVGGGQAAADAVLVRLDQAWTQPEGVGFSAGRASREPGEDGQHLSERADQALYAAKRHSRHPQNPS
jgi:diguanylate cyclase (GGDEF)-like protein